MKLASLIPSHPNSTSLGTGLALGASILLAACGSAATPAPTAPAASASTAATSSSVPASARPSADAGSASKPAASASTAAAASAGASAAAQAKPAAPVPLTLYAATGYDDAMAKAFQTATGIPVNLVADSTGPLLAKIQAEKNNPQWSMVWIDGAEAIAALDQQGMLLRGYTPNVDWSAQGKSLLPKNQSYFPMHVTVVGVLFYDSKNLSSPPATWQDLLKPEWKNMVGMNNPSISGPTYPFVAGVMDQMGGEDQGKAYFKQLKSNGLQVFNKNKDTLHAMDIGQIKMSAVQSSAGYAILDKNPTLKAVYPSKVVLLPNVMAIDGKAPAQVQAEAKQFAEFALSPKGQQIAADEARDGDSWHWPVLNGGKALPGMPDINSIPAAAVDPYVWGPKEDEINQWFTDNIVP